MFHFKTRQFQLILCALIIATILTWQFLALSKPPTNANSVQTVNRSAVLGAKQSHTKQFFEEKLFYQGLNQAKSELKSDPNLDVKLIKGGIVPHHLFPSFVLSGFFQRLQIQSQTSPIKQVIVIGPNHQEGGDNWALSSLYNWSTPFGEVEPDLPNIRALQEGKIVQIDEKVLNLEHSIGGIAPYLKYYLPEAKITPVILKYKISQIELENLSQTLANLSQNSDTVVIASVDFSHYLPADIAKKRDIKTMEILKNYDFNQLLGLNNDYLDSPASIATLLKTMRKLKTTDQTVLYHTNSGILENDFSGQTTSYICLVFKAD